MKSYLQILLILLGLVAGNASAQYGSRAFNWNLEAYEKLTYITPNGQMPYRLLKPAVNDPSKKYPLVIMLHGKGEGMGSDCSNQNGINYCQLGWGGKMHLDSINKYPAFVVFPQTYGGGWSGAGADGIYPDDPTPPIKLLSGLLQYLFTTYNIDLNRVYIHGLSGGGSGVWEMLGRYPHLFAATSPHSAAGNTHKASNYVFNSIWTVQGELDSNPSAGLTKRMMDSLQKYGQQPLYTLDVNTGKQKYPSPAVAVGRPIYSLVPNSGHVVWPNLYNSPTWMAWMFSQNKLRIQSLGGRNTTFTSTSIFNGDSVVLGITQGFDAYQWSTGETTNKIVVKTGGQYRVRFLRKAAFFSGTPVWTDWSDPFTVNVINTTKDLTPPTAPTHVTVLDKTSQEVYLKWNSSTDNVKLIGYEVYSGSTVIATTTDTTVTIQELIGQTNYSFTVKAYDSAGNRSAPSNQVSFTTDKAVYGLNYSYYEGSWTALPDFTKLTPKRTGFVQNFYLSQKSRGSNYGFVFDGYIEIKKAGTYTFYDYSDDGSRLLVDNNTIINNDGVHDPVERAGTIYLNAGRHKIKVLYFQTTGIDLLEINYSGPGISKQMIPQTSLLVHNDPDNSAPTAPLNLVSTGKGAVSVDLFWNSASDDLGVAGYEVYTNGTFSLFTTELSATVNGLEPSTAYNFTVKAKDIAGNLSPSSNSITVTTNAKLNGVKFSYYEAWMGSTMPNFDTMTAVQKGLLTNFNLTPRKADDNFGFMFESFIDIAKDGVYTFYTNSDDGSNLYVNNSLVVNNDGAHATREKSGTISLAKGRYPIKVTFFERTGSQVLEVRYAGPGITKQFIPDNKLFLTGLSGPVNHDPVIATIGNKQVVEGDSLMVTITASDIDNDTIVFTTGSLPSFASFIDHKNRTATFKFKPGSTDAGAYTITVNASDLKGGTDLETFTVMVKDSSTKNNLVLYRINSGGYDLPATGSSSLLWGHDNYNSPSIYYNKAESGNKPFNGFPPVTLDPSVPPGTPSEIFQSERALGSTTNPIMQYNLPVAVGSQVEVRLFFSENFFSDPNKRKFNIAIDDSVKLTNFDIYAEAGRDKGIMKSYIVTSDSIVNINLIKVIQLPKISGIEIICLNDFCNKNNLHIAKMAAKSIEEKPSTSSISAYPNPFVNNVSVSLSSGEIDNGVMKIFNSMGDMLSEHPVNLNTGSDISIDLSSYPIGVYFLKIYSNTGDIKETIRLVKH